MPRSILYDNTTLAVVEILADGQRVKTRRFLELQSHYLFADRFGRAGKGNDKGKVEGLVGYARRNFLVPIPAVESYAALNAHLAAQCRQRQSDQLRGHEETIGERLVRDQAAFLPLPTAPYDACEIVATRVSSLSLVRYRGNDYSVPTAYGHREVVVKGYVEEVLIHGGADIIARHPRSYDKAGISSLSPATIWPCWNVSSMPWTRQLLWRTGICQRLSKPYDGCWKHGWAKPASANTSRCYACWRGLN